jgi:hypothetical protein
VETRLINCLPVAMTLLVSCTYPLEYIVVVFCMAQSGLPGSHLGDSYIMSILGMSSSSNSAVLGQRTLKQLGTLCNSSGIGIQVHRGINFDGLRKNAGLGTQILGVSLMTTPFNRHCMGLIKWLSIEWQWISCTPCQ